MLYLYLDFLQVTIFTKFPFLSSQNIQKRQRILENHFEFLACIMPSIATSFGHNIIKPFYFTKSI